MSRYEEDRSQYECEWFTQWFKKALGKRKITVESFSELTGLGQTTAMYYRNGVRSPSLKTFLMILDVLGYEMQITEKQ